MRCVRSRLFFAGLLLVCFGAAGAALLRGGGLLYFGPVVSDLGEQFYLWRVFACRWLHQGVYPFWDMHAFGGYPVIEMQQLALFHPVALLTALFFEPAFGLKLWMAMNFILGGVASYVALRRGLACRAGAAFLGTMAFFFGAAYATRVEAGHFAVVGATALWIPALVAAWILGGEVSRCGLRRLAKMPSVVGAGMLANALIVLAGSPQYVVYIFYAQLVAVLVASSEGRRLAALLSLAVLWGGGAALSAPQWFPTLFYLPFTGRSSGSWMLAPRAADRWNFWVEFFLPFPLGDELSSGHLHLKNVWETATYPGTLTTVLALGTLLAGLGGWRRRWPLPLRMAWAIVLLGLYLCGGGWLPGFGSFREPMKARAVVGLGMALVGAVGGQRLAASARLGRTRKGAGAWPSVGVALAFSVAAASAALALPRLGDDVGAWFLQGGPPIDSLRQADWLRVWEAPARVLPAIAAACWKVAGWAALGAFLLAIAHVGGNVARMAAPLLFVAAALDPFASHIHVFVARHPFERLGLHPELEKAMRAELERTRREGRLPWRVTLPPALANRGHLLEGLWETGGYDPLMPRDANNRVTLVTKRRELPVEERRTTIALAVGRRYDLTQWAVGQGEPLGDLNRFEVAPHASLFSLERQLVAGYAGVADFGPNLDTGEHYVDVAPPAGYEARPPAAAVTGFVQKVKAQGQVTPARAPDRVAVIETNSPNEYAYRVTCASPALAIFRTTWLPGWEVWIDGRRWGRAWCANRWMLAAPIDAGEHEVRWRYRPVGLRGCLAVSAMTSLGLLGWLVGWWLRAGRKKFERC